MTDQQIKELREKIVGKQLLIIHMDGEPQYSGKTGVVKSVDDMGQIHGTWGGCALSPEYGDKCIIIG